jgi:hypothetical protein
MHSLIIIAQKKYGGGVAKMHAPQLAGSQPDKSAIYSIKFFFLHG